MLYRDFVEGFRNRAYQPIPPTPRTPTFALNLQPTLVGDAWRIALRPTLRGNETWAEHDKRMTEWRAKGIIPQ